MVICSRQHQALCGSFRFSRSSRHDRVGFGPASKFGSLLAIRVRDVVFFQVPGYWHGFTCCAMPRALETGRSLLQHVNFSCELACVLEFDPGLASRCLNDSNTISCVILFLCMWQNSSCMCFHFLKGGCDILRLSESSCRDHFDSLSVVWSTDLCFSSCCSGQFPLRWLDLKAITVPDSGGARDESGEIALSCTQSGAHRPCSMRRKLDEDVVKLHLSALPFAGLQAMPV